MTFQKEIHFTLESSFGETQHEVPYLSANRSKKSNQRIRKAQSAEPGER